jgi:O-methyltransferase
MTTKKNSVLVDMSGAYLDLLQKVLAGVIIEDPPIANDRHRALFRFLAKLLHADTYPDEAEMARYQFSFREQGLDWPSRAFTMIGLKRLFNFRTLIERAIAQDIPGDVLEAGVWRGGASIMARAVLRAYGEQERRVFVADSFEGLPPPNPLYPADSESDLHQQPELAVSLETVRSNFEKFGLLDDRVVFLKGWFRDTLPNAPVTQLAVLRLDGDMYESTFDTLTHLFDKVSPGGWVIVDDYFIPSCRAAVSDFLGARKLAPDMLKIDMMGVYFQKKA